MKGRKKRRQRHLGVALNSRLVRDKDGAILFVEGMVGGHHDPQTLGRSIGRIGPLHQGKIITHANEGVVVYDRELRYLVWNRFMENLTGLSSQDALGHCTTDLFPHIREQGIDQLIVPRPAGRDDIQRRYSLPCPADREDGMGTEYLFPPCERPGGVSGSSASSAISRNGKRPRIPCARAKRRLWIWR